MNKEKKPNGCGCLISTVLIWICIFIALEILSGCSTQDEIINNDTYISINNYNDLSYDEKDIIYFINYEREKAGLTTITSDEFAGDVEYPHIDFLVYIDDINHDGFISRRDKLINRGAWGVSEILAMKFNNPEFAVQAWMNSINHRNAILNPLFDAAGFVVIENQYKDKWYGVLFIDYKNN